MVEANDSHISYLLVSNHDCSIQHNIPQPVYNSDLEWAAPRYFPVRRL